MEIPESQSPAPQGGGKRRGLLALIERATGGDDPLYRNNVAGAASVPRSRFRNYIKSLGMRWVQLREKMRWSPSKAWRSASTMNSVAEQAMAQWVLMRVSQPWSWRWTRSWSASA